jgi:aspartokinase/homoserine dehydrogenase 1
MGNSLLVMKFGGTSLGSPERIGRVADLCAKSGASRPTVVVVSAMSKVTDLLLDTLVCGESGDEQGVQDGIRTLEEKHIAAARELLPAERQDAAIVEIEAILKTYARIARGMLMLRERPARAVDEAITTGEQLSALLVAELLQSRGIAAARVDAAGVIATDEEFGSASPLMAETAERAKTAIGPLLAAGTIPVVTGFNGSTLSGERTTLGRGGSDFSAAIIAAALGSSDLWIWTDVDGILTGDPRIVPDARVLPSVTYNEASELAYNGAKVLHARTLQPLVDCGIPVRIKNSFNPDAPGTRISAQLADSHSVGAVTSFAHVTLVSIEAVSLTQSGAQLMARALAAAGRSKTEILLLTRSSFRQNFCMLVRTEDVETVTESLREELALELAHGYVHPIEIDNSVGLLASVGEGMKGAAGLAGRLFTAISAQQINIIAIAQGSSELTIAIVVKQDRLQDAVRAVHEVCGLGRAGAAPVEPQAEHAS